MGKQIDLYDMIKECEEENGKKEETNKGRDEGDRRKRTEEETL